MVASDKLQFQSWNEEIGKFNNDELFPSHALLLGHETYVGSTAAWSSSEKLKDM